MSRRTWILVSLMLALWALSPLVLRHFVDWDTAGNIGDSFGGVSSLFSGIALALAVYSMVLQQKQAAEFEARTLQSEQRLLEALNSQAKALALLEQGLQSQADNAQLLKTSLQRQADVARVQAMSISLERYEQRVESLKAWGRSSYQDEYYYRSGIDAAKRKAEAIEAELHRLGQVQGN
jgi:hypothetical protein